jgi:replicative DNA helicase
MTNPERVPPHSLEAERAALGSVLLVPASIDELGALAVDDFFLPAHREIFEAMLALNKRGRRIEILGLIAELKANGMLSRLENGELYLDKLSNDISTGEMAKVHAETIGALAVQRRLIRAAGEIQAAAYGSWHDVGELLAEAREKVSSVELSNQAGGPVKIGDKLGDALDSIEHRATDPSAYFVTTGMRAFDEQVGGLRGGNMIVVATRPGMGKSAWTLDILLHAADQGVPCLLFSMEMSIIEIIERALAKRATVNGRHVVTGRMEAPEWRKIHGAARALKDSPIWVDGRALTAKRICSEARRWRVQLRKARRAIIAIDYLGLVDSEDMDERSRAVEIGKMTKAFKRLAVEMDDPLILVAQLNREVVKTGRKPHLSDLRDSGSIEQDANMVVFPWWESPVPVVGRHPAQLIVGKNRGGPTGDVECDWEPEYIRFVDKEGGGYADKAQQELIQ